MRRTAELQQLVDSVLRVSGGTAQFAIAAQDQEEAGVLAGLLRGRHGAKAISIEILPPEAFVPPVAWEDRPGVAAINPTK